MYLKLGRRSLAAFFCLATFFSLASLSPGTLNGQGYNSENLKACAAFTANLFAGFGDSAVYQPVEMPPHGVVELVFIEPFFLLSRALFDDWKPVADRITSFQPIAITALICTLVFIWSRRITNSAVWAYVLALVTGFGTMLWPYAYIGLETTQSLFVLLAGWMALGSQGKRGWGRTILFALVCGVAVSVKSNGLFLVPAVLWLAGVYTWADQRFTRSRKWISFTILIILAAIYMGSSRSRGMAPMWAKFGGSGFPSLRSSIVVDNVLFIPVNAFGFFGSLNKSLLIYAPVVILALAAMPSAWKANKATVIYALLVLLGLVFGCSISVAWSDETWGPRYLHSAIAPLVICLATARSDTRFRLYREIPLLALGSLGLGVSLLGALFYYGNLFGAATLTGQATLESLQYDPALNHIRFNMNLARAGLSRMRDPEGPHVTWQAKHRWWFFAPPDAPPSRAIDVESMLTPQPILGRERPLETFGPIWYFYLASLIFGLAGIAVLGVTTVTAARSAANVAPDDG